MILGRTKRPRNVDSPRAAAILYGDWGTRKAYVIGLAFAVAGYSSFWLILAMSALLALVGINYMAICRHYPDGGGVYASVYHRSKIIAIVGAFLLIAISFLMSRDGELPSRFEKLNGFGVPNLGLIVATIIPAILVVAVKDVAGLAELYAVGVVGAIATNLGATSTDNKLNLAPWERALMFCTFLVMAAIEISLLIEKPGARLFAGSVVAVGLILHGITAARKGMHPVAPTPEIERAVGSQPRFELPKDAAHVSPMLCAVRGIGGTLDFAIEIAKDMNRPLYVAFVREQAILTLEDRKRHWADDVEARKIFAYATEKADGHPILHCYTVSDVPAHTIVDLAIKVGASHLILGAPRRNLLIKLIRGNMILQVSRFLPEGIHLLVYA